jgi:hypothetical protein
MNITKSVNVMKRLVTTYIVDHHSVLVLITVITSNVLMLVLLIQMSISIVKTLLIPYVIQVQQDTAIQMNVNNLVVQLIKLSLLLVDLLLDMSNTVRKIVLN